MLDIPKNTRPPFKHYPLSIQKLRNKPYAIKKAICDLYRDDLEISISIAGYKDPITQKMMKEYEELLDYLNVYG